MGNRKIEYVFGPPQPEFGHALGVGALRMNSETLLTPNSHGTLFSGGRDGRVNAWSLLGDTAMPSLVNTCHTNTVSALMPFTSNQVVSCSTDTTVKVWNLHENEVTKLGHHNDYVECLTHFSSAVVASGGLDNCVNGWDVGTQKKAFEISVNHSVYTISSVRDQIIITGSPDGAVRIWDPRQRKQVMKLAGHTDSVRSILVSDDNVLSGSSDGTAVLWSLRYGRALRTMSQFDSSIWVLRPNGNGYFAGDRNGSLYASESLESEPTKVYKNVLTHGGLKGLVFDESTSGLWLSTPFQPDIKRIDVEGRETQTLHGHNGLRKHRMLNDKRRALVADTNKVVHMVDLVGAKALNFERRIPVEQDVDDGLDDILSEVNTMDVLDNWCQVEVKAGRVYVILDKQSVNNTEVYLDELTKYVNTGSGNNEATPLNSPLHSPVGSGFFKPSPAVSRVTSSQSLEKTLQKTTTRSSRRRASKLMHDLGSGKGKVAFYDPDESDSDSDNESVASGNAKKEGQQSSPSTQNQNIQSKQSTQSPMLLPKADPSNRLSLSLSETLLFRSRSRTTLAHDNIEPKSVTQHKTKIVQTEEPADEETADDEIRINLGNFVLENLLRGVIDNLMREYNKDKDASAQHEHHQPNSVVEQQNRLPDPVPTTPSPVPETPKKKKNFLNKLFGHNKSKPVKPVAKPKQPEPKKVEDENVSAQRLKEERHNKLIKQPDSNTFAEAWKRASSAHAFQAADPEAPVTEVIGRNTQIIITEAAPGAGAPTEIFCSTVGKLMSSQLEDEEIMKILPGWVGDAVLLGKLNLKKPTKIGFSVIPNAPGLPDLTTDDTRLTAISMLRMRKIMAYIIGQMQKKNILTADASNFQPEEIVKLTCNNTNIDPLVTLATVRTRIWPHGGDVSLEYSLIRRV